VSGRLADEDKGVWKVSRQGLQTRTRVSGRLGDVDKDRRGTVLCEIITYTVR
jgi:hypothetical protein